MLLKLTSKTDLVLHRAHEGVAVLSQLVLFQTYQVDVNLEGKELSLEHSE